MPKKTRKFKTEVQQLLDLVIHSLYTKKEIYLRELLSNASDAIDRARFEALTNKELIEGDPQWQIKIRTDRKARTLTITDNGIGMNQAEVDENIGTIASSGTRRFIEGLRKGQGQDGAAQDAEMIGQFGVGFYSAFMVADKVTLLTRRAGPDQKGVRWESAGAGDYTIEECDKATRGTEITLHLKDGLDEYLEDWQIQKTVKTYSDYLAYPVVMDIRRQKEGKEDEEEVVEETLNSMKAIWKKAKKEIADTEYKEFYHHVSHDHLDPLEIIHFSGEGKTEFRALLYLPAHAPVDLYLRDDRRGLQLFVKNVFITDSCRELLPDYLRFVKGVVDSSDVPLNVSRETLQDDAVIRRIRKGLVSKVLGTLKDMRDKRRDTYYKFFAQFGRILKEGIHQDFENREKLQELVLFASTKSKPDQPTSLREYVDRMPADQKAIYYLTGDQLSAVANSPYLERLKEKDYEALFFVDPIDEWVTHGLTSYADKPLRAVHRGDLDLDSDEEKKTRAEKSKAAEGEYAELLKFIKATLKDDVKDVRLSHRLTSSACCLVADENSLNANLERILQSMNQEFQPTKRTLELNPAHPVLGTMKALLGQDRQSPRLADYVFLLHNQALLAEGSPLREPQRFTKLVSELMVAAK